MLADGHGGRPGILDEFLEFHLGMRRADEIDAEVGIMTVALPHGLGLLPQFAVVLILFHFGSGRPLLCGIFKQQDGVSSLTDQVWPQSLSVANEALSVGVGVHGPREALPRASGGAVRWFQRECRLQHS